jgi:hypothetical protein
MVSELHRVRDCRTFIKRPNFVLEGAGTPLKIHSYELAPSTSKIKSNGRDGATTKVSGRSVSIRISANVFLTKSEQQDKKQMQIITKKNEI